MTKSAQIQIGVLLIAGLLVGLAQSKIAPRHQWPYPALDKLVMTEYYTSDLATLALGARRLAADLAYIQTLQYYGERQFLASEDDDHADEEEADHHHHHRHGMDYGAGHYPRMKEWGFRIAHLDPYFHTPVLEIAGALAFNLSKIDDALELLREAILLDQSFYRYRVYVAAILFRHERKDNELIALLEQAINEPACPPMLENVLANLHKRTGNTVRAAEVFWHTYQTAPTEGARDTALRGLERLLKEHPEAAAGLPREAFH